MYLRILHQNQKAEASLKLEVTEKQLHQWNAVTQSFEPSRDPLNVRINRTKADYENFLALNNVHLSYTAKEILNKLIGKTAIVEAVIPLTVVKYIDSYLLDNINGSSRLKEGTKRNYRKSITHFKNYLKDCGYLKLELKEFNFEKANKFDIYLSNIYYENKKTKMLPVSASSIVIKIKAIFEYAVNADLILKNPFRGVKIITESKEKKPQLSITEVAQIFKKDLSNYPILEVYRDMFLFGCFSGLAYGDIFNLKWANISKDIFGTKLMTQRIKTDLPVEQYLVSYAELILDRYKDNIQANINGTVFPPRSLTHLNINIKRLADICGITKKMSSHNGRHTCSGLMDQAEIPDDIVASRMMGWTTGKKTSWIYKSVTDSSLFNLKNKFQVYLDKYLHYGSGDC